MYSEYREAFPLEVCVVKDAFGNEIREGDLVVVPLGLGQAANAKVEKIDLGLGLGIGGGTDAVRRPDPAIFVSFLLQMSAPNGIVRGVLKVSSSRNNDITKE